VLRPDSQGSRSRCGQAQWAGSFLGLDAAKLSGQVPFAKQAALFEAAAVHLEDSCFGLHFGSGADPIDLDALGYVATGSPALGDGLRSILTYLMACMPS
jgi:hypothetical protein